MKDGDTIITTERTPQHGGACHSLERAGLLADLDLAGSRLERGLRPAG
jgi:hypothetical protein